MRKPRRPQHRLRWNGPARKTPRSICKNPRSGVRRWPPQRRAAPVYWYAREVRHRAVAAVEVRAPALCREPSRAVLEQVRSRHRRRQRAVDRDTPAANGKRTTGSASHSSSPVIGLARRSTSDPITTLNLASRSTWSLPDRGHLNDRSTRSQQPHRHGEVPTTVARHARPLLL
jgi:hypothetical protein